MYEEHVPERVLEPEECAALARSVAALMPTPAPADEGSFTLLWRTTPSEGWLNVWPEARDGISLDGNPTVRRFAAGDSFSLGPDRIHRMIHDAGSTTVHVYSPPLRAIGDYAVVGGELRRVTHAPDEMSPPSRGF
jgi:hypothetical protein